MVERWKWLSKEHHRAKVQGGAFGSATNFILPRRKSDNDKMSRSTTSTLSTSSSAMSKEDLTKLKRNELQGLCKVS